MSIPDSPVSLDDYRGYKGLPPVVGLQNMQEVAARGLTVEESVTRLKRHHWFLKRLHEIFIHRLTSMPIYELKMAFSLHSHYCAEHITAMRERVREMREPPYGLDKTPHATLDVFFDEIRAAPNIESLILGIYGKALPSLIAGVQRHLDDSNRLFDHPTYRICRFALLELQEMQAYGDQAITCLVDQSILDQYKDWLNLLDNCLVAADTRDKDHDAISDFDLTRQFSAKPYVYDSTPQRDERFIDPYNMGVNAEAMLLDPAIAPQPKVLMMYFKRLREIDVPEMMASILAETDGKPWSYTRDMTRQLWDEARHAMMGEVGFVSMGIDWTSIPINFTWSLGLNAQLAPKQRHAVLFFIEQGLMPAKTGKQYEWEVAVAAADPLSAKIQDYDWADEILHARIGRDWLVAEIGSQAEAMAYGSECWSRVLGDWKLWKDQGLTEHRNWWPEVYTAACKHWGVTLDPAVLAYNTSYQEIRADLKNV